MNETSAYLKWFDVTTIINVFKTTCMTFQCRQFLIDAICMFHFKSITKNFISKFWILNIIIEIFLACPYEIFFIKILETDKAVCTFELPIKHVETLRLTFYLSYSYFIYSWWCIPLPYHDLCSRTCILCTMMFTSIQNDMSANQTIHLLYQLSFSYSWPSPKRIWWWHQTWKSDVSMLQCNARSLSKNHENIFLP